MAMFALQASSADRRWLSTSILTCGVTHSCSSGANSLFCALLGTYSEEFCFALRADAS
jgi:hypothetical protein